MIDSVIETITDEIATLRINNPPFNLIDDGVCSALNHAILEAERSEQVQCIILDFDGTAAPLDHQRCARPSHDILVEICDVIENLNTAVIALVTGRLHDGALALACAAHYRIAGKNAELECSNIAWGGLPSGGLTQRLPRLIGAEVSLNILGSAQVIAARSLRDTEFAQNWGRRRILELAKNFGRTNLANDINPRRTRDLRSEMANGMQYQKTVQAARLNVTSNSVLAARKLIDCVEAALLLPFDAGIDFEREAFEDCCNAASFYGLSRAIRAQSIARKLPAAVQVSNKSPQKLGLIGAENLGKSLAENAIHKGISVNLYDPNSTRLDQVQQNIIATLDRALSDGSITAQDRTTRISALQINTTLVDIATCDLVIESASEDEAVQRNIFAQLVKNTTPGTVLTSTNPHVAMPQTVVDAGRPADFLQLNFCDLIRGQNIVEIGVSSATSPDAMAVVHRCLAVLGVDPIYVTAAQGMVGPQLLAVLRYTACELVLMGASPNLVDQTMRGFGFPVGPFEDMDREGLAHAAALRQGMQHLLGLEVDPIDLVDQIAANGWLGQQSNAGFYIYDHGESTLNPGIESIIANCQIHSKIVPRAIQPGEVRRRVWMALCNHGGHLLDAGVAPSAAVIDAIAVDGYGYPMLRGGPMATAERAGLAGVVRDLKLLGQENPFWRPSDAILQANLQGQAFPRESD